MNRRACCLKHNSELQTKNLLLPAGQPLWPSAVCGFTPRRLAPGKRSVWEEDAAQGPLLGQAVSQDLAGLVWRNFSPLVLTAAACAEMPQTFPSSNRAGALVPGCGRTWSAHDAVWTRMACPGLHY